MTDQFQQTPDGLHCETTVNQVFTKTACTYPATHIYGPECERETGKLMYLCEFHAGQISIWRLAHPNDPVECPTHGRIGKVKDYLILRRM